jgi:hypothetical protein
MPGCCNSDCTPWTAHITTMLLPPLLLLLLQMADECGVHFESVEAPRLQCATHVPT